MKVKLSFNDLELIVEMLEKRIEKLQTGLTSMHSELNEIYYSDKPRDEAADMRAEELENMIDTDTSKRAELKNLLTHLRVHR